MKLKLQLKMLLIKIIFEWKVILGIFADSWPVPNPMTAKDVCLLFLSIFWILQFLSHFLFLLKARNLFIWFCSKFRGKQTVFFASKWTILLLRSKPVQWNYRHFFKDFKKRSVFLTGPIKLFDSLPKKTNMCENLTSEVGWNKN